MYVCILVCLINSSDATVVCMLRRPRPFPALCNGWLRQLSCTGYTWFSAQARWRGTSRDERQSERRTALHLIGPARRSRHLIGRGATMAAIALAENADPIIQNYNIILGEILVCDVRMFV